MKIWLINDYNMLPEHGHLNRNYYLGKALTKQGHEVVAFSGSHPHNTNLQLIEGHEKYKVYKKNPFPWVLIKTRNYEGSKIKRVISMFEFYRNMKKTANHFDKPDVIIGSSAHPLAALAAIKLGKRYGCKGIMEIRDLWPESIVAYGVLPRTNPVVKMLYKFEEYLYTHADKLIFTMENAWQYFEDRGLDKVVPREKVHYVNNGVDLEEFEKNEVENPFFDEDLDNKDHFNIVYTGSIRHVNNLGLLLDAAKIVQNKKVRFLIWGDGDELEKLKRRVFDEQVNNVIFKGRVEKKFVPSILTKADATFAHNQETPLFKYGISFNKLFDYLAAGNPILFDFKAGHNPAIENDAGISCESNDPRLIAKMVDDISTKSPQELERYKKNTIATVSKYTFDNLANKMIKII